MKLTDFYAYTEQTFDSFCKQVIRNERTDALRELAYWQASGESIKTSVRVKTRMEQLTQDGLFTGGSIPYG